MNDSILIIHETMTPIDQLTSLEKDYEKDP